METPEHTLFISTVFLPLLLSSVWPHSLLRRVNPPHKKQCLSVLLYRITPEKYCLTCLGHTPILRRTYVGEGGSLLMVERFFDCTSLGEEAPPEDDFPKGGRILLPGDAISGEEKCHNHRPMCDMPEGDV